MVMPPDDYFSDPQFKQLEAQFHSYVAQGEGRNISWLVAKTGLPLNVVARGMVKGMWPQRIQDIGKDAAVAVQAKLVGDVSGMNEHDVARLLDMEELAWGALKRAIQEDRVKPDTLAKIAFQSQERRRKMLGVDENGGQSLADRLGKLLESSLPDAEGGEKEEEAKPFVLDLKMLEAPADLPTMPGMTSDAPPVNERDRDLDDDEKEALRG